MIPHEWGEQKPNGERWCVRCHYVKALVSNGYTLRVRYRRQTATRWTTKQESCVANTIEGMMTL